MRSSSARATSQDSSVRGLSIEEARRIVASEPTGERPADRVRLAGLRMPG